MILHEGNVEYDSVETFFETMIKSYGKRSLSQVNVHHSNEKERVRHRLINSTNQSILYMPFNNRVTIF
jgi:hypothetical protein